MKLVYSFKMYIVLWSVAIYAESVCMCVCLQYCAAVWTC